MKNIAFTFDDGPNLTTTIRMLDVLKENDAKATFFLVGKNITDETVPVIRREMEQGCEICCHSTEHADMKVMTAEEVKADIDNCVEKITAVTGYKPRFFRPPFISVSQTMYDVIDMPFICGFGCNDWMPPVTADERIGMMMPNMNDGAMFLLHDMPGNENTVEVVRRLIPELKKQGFNFVTVSELFEINGIVPERGILYSNVYQKK